MARDGCPYWATMHADKAIKDGVSGRNEMRQTISVWILAVFLLSLALPTIWIGNEIPNWGCAFSRSQENRTRLDSKEYTQGQSGDESPDWVLKQLELRSLVKQYLAEAMKWQSSEGYITDGINKWMISDKPQLYLNWTSYYLLSGDERIYTALKKAIFLYLHSSSDQWDHGYLKNPTLTTQSTLEALTMLANLAYAKPDDQEVVQALGDMVEHCIHQVAGCARWYDKTSKHMVSTRLGTREVLSDCPDGVDWPFNLQWVKLALAYYVATGKSVYLDWCQDYLDGWIATMERNERENGVYLLPWEVDAQTGALGRCSGQWWQHGSDPYWGWTYGSFAAAADLRGAFLDYFRLSGKRNYLAAIKKQINFTFSKSSNFAPSIWLQGGKWVNDDRSFCAAPLAVSASLLDPQADPSEEARLLRWYENVDAPTFEQFFWHFRRYGYYSSIQTVLERTSVWVRKNINEFTTLKTITKPDRFPDLEGVEGLTMSAFGGLPSDRGEMPWTEIMYYRENNLLGLEEGVAAMVERSTDSSRVVALYNTSSQARTVKLQADYLPRFIVSLSINQQPLTLVHSFLAVVSLPPSQLVRVTLHTSVSDTIPPLSPQNLRLLAASESELHIAWDPPLPALDGETATSYRIQRQDLAVVQQDSTRFHDCGLEKGATYRYQVFSIDAAGNVSRIPTTASFATSRDATPPATPTGLVALPWK